MTRRLLISLMFIVCVKIVFAQTCTYSFNGSTGGTVNSGETGCLDGNFSGTINVQSGGVLKVCGVHQVSGSVSVYGTGKMILTEGSSVEITLGSITFNDQNQLEYSGDPSCNAEIFKTLGSANVLMPVAGPLTSSSNLYLDGFWWQWGSAATKGSANIGRAPSLCGGSFGACEGFLPIELAYFKVFKESDEIALIWKTLMEINNDYFIVERSVDGIHWQEIAQIDGKGNSLSESNYKFIEKGLKSGTYFYRLSQVDFQGEPLKLATESLKVDGEQFSIFPNPVSKSFSVDMDASSIEIISSSGEVVKKYGAYLKGNPIEVNDLAKGVYFIKLFNNNLFHSSKLIKVDL